MAADVCINCPNNTNTVTIGSNNKTNCKGNQGYTGPDGGECVECENGKYKSSIGSDPCITCPLNVISFVLETRTNPTCVCLAGFYATNDRGCVMCEVDTYKPEPGLFSYGLFGCEACPSNTISPAGSTALSQCTCAPGFAGPDTCPCVICPENTWKSQSGNHICNPCSFKSVSPAGSSTCLCVEGWTGLNGIDCSACPAAKYKGGTNSATCTECPAGNISPIESIAITDCQCNAGWSGDDFFNHLCLRCVAGKYKTILGNDECTRCHGGKYSTLVNATSDVCISCPSGSDLPMGSNQLSDCKCPGGYEGNEGDVFTACNA